MRSATDSLLIHHRHEYFSSSRFDRFRGAVLPRRTLRTGSLRWMAVATSSQPMQNVDDFWVFVSRTQRHSANNTYLGSRTLNCKLRSYARPRPSPSFVTLPSQCNVSDGQTGLIRRIFCETLTTCVFLAVPLAVSRSVCGS